MSSDRWDRERWDEKYRRREIRDDDGPGRLLLERAGLLPPAGRALGLACGDGRNEVFLALRGLEVTGVDVSPVGLALTRDRADRAGVSVETVEADLKTWTPTAGTWDVVTVFDFLEVDLLPRVREAVRPGGLVFYETFGVEQLESPEGPRRREWLLEPGQLLTAFAGFRVLVYEDLGPGDDPRESAAKQRLVARRPS